MTLHLPTLLYVCVAVLAMSAGVMTLFGATQRSYRGFWWWTAAQWMLTVGLLLQTVRDEYPSVLPLSNLLMMQWPIVVLGGMGSFLGAMVGGLIVGLTESFGGLFLGESLGQIGISLIFILILLLRPSGLFGAKQ